MYISPEAIADIKYFLIAFSLICIALLMFAYIVYVIKKIIDFKGEAVKLPYKKDKFLDE